MDSQIFYHQYKRREIKIEMFNVNTFKIVFTLLFRPAVPNLFETITHKSG